ncbi:hypothetical protein H8N01_12085 [Streptomyces sp. AC536]|nr:hypothetical protein [Streptomyces buecherae]MBC3983276.1 hypothetical protein [Streptomyces buecherae]QNJ42638.1 hypothetical protein H7H31_25210 [Streptomyces buecherae]
MLADDQVPESERVRSVVEIEGAMSSAENIARRIDDSGPDESTFADSLYVRYGVQDTISRVAPRAVELTGSLGSLDPDEVGHLATGALGLALHPPARLQTTDSLASYLTGGPLILA